MRWRSLRAPVALAAVSTVVVLGAPAQAGAAPAAGADLVAVAPEPAAVPAAAPVPTPAVSEPGPVEADDTSRTIQIRVSIAPASPPGQLPRTGVALGTILALGAALLAAGAGLRALARNRRWTNPLS